MTPWVLGLDGGGSKTALAYANAAGEVVGPFYGPGINPFDQPEWARLLTELLGAHPAPGPLAHATLGLPGYGETGAVSEAQRQAAAGLLNVPTTLMNDVEAAFQGAFTHGVGVLLLAGTGSMAWASDGSHQRRAGGWGDAFGDEGSAYWLGREALSVASRALDWRHHDRLFAQEFLGAALGLNARDPDIQARLLGWLYAQPHGRSAIASLARHLLPLVEDGQPTAHGLAKSAARHLAQHVVACRAALSAPHLRWSYAGGLLRSAALRDLISEALEEAPQAPVLPPLGGALWHAASRVGAPDASWAGQVGQALSDPPL